MKFIWNLIVHTPINSTHNPPVLHWYEMGLIELAITKMLDRFGNKNEMQNNGLVFNLSIKHWK